MNKEFIDENKLSNNYSYLYLILMSKIDNS